MAQLSPPPADFNEVEANRDITAEPNFIGWHPMQIVESDARLARSGNGEITALVAQVTDGTFKGRKLFVNLNLSHASSQAEEIAWRELKAICTAVGLSTWPKDTVELHNRPFMGNVKYTPEGPDRNGTHRAARNEIASGGYKPMGAAVSGSTAAAPAPAPSASVPQWKRRAS